MDQYQKTLGYIRKIDSSIMDFSIKDMGWCWEVANQYTGNHQTLIKNNENALKTNLFSVQMAQVNFGHNLMMVLSIYL